MKLVFTSNVTPWPKSIDCKSGLHQESRERLWLCPRKELSGLKSPWQSGDSHQGSPPITDRGIAPHSQKLKVLWKSTWECAHEMKTLSWIETEVKFKITLMRPSSRSWLCGFTLKGLIQDLLFLLLKDGLSLLRIRRVPLCSPLSILWVCMICSLHPRMMDPRGNICNFNCCRGS